RQVQKAIADGDLREDLYYRLAVVEIFLPPMRERLGDVKLLATEFLARFGQQNGKKVTGFDDESWSWILNYRWPGNVRELKNAVERAVIMSTSPTITLSDIAPRHLRNATEAAALPPAVAIPRRRSSDRTGVQPTPEDARLAGMTRDELFEAFDTFLRDRAARPEREMARPVARVEGLDTTNGAE